MLPTFTNSCEKKNIVMLQRFLLLRVFSFGPLRYVRVEVACLRTSYVAVAKRIDHYKQQHFRHLNIFFPFETRCDHERVFWNISDLIK